MSRGELIEVSADDAELQTVIADFVTSRYVDSAWSGKDFVFRLDDSRDLLNAILICTGTLKK